MAVAFVNATESVRTATTDPYTFTFTPSSAIRGFVLCAVHGTSATDHILTVTYGGVALSELGFGEDTATEPGRVDMWFRGDGLPAGAQTVSIDLASATTDDIQFVGIGLSSAANPILFLSGTAFDGDQASPQDILPTRNLEAITIGALYSGLPNVGDPAILAGMTAVHDHDFGNFVARVDRQTTPSIVPLLFGWTSATDDVAAVIANFAEAGRYNPKRDVYPHILGH